MSSKSNSTGWKQDSMASSSAGTKLQNRDQKTRNTFRTPTAFSITGGKQDSMSSYSTGTKLQNRDQNIRTTFRTPTAFNNTGEKQYSLSSYSTGTKLQNRDQNMRTTFRIPTAFNTTIKSYAEASATTLNRDLIASSIESRHTNHRDLEMAMRQSRYATLRATERDQQDKWAQEEILKSGACINGWKWVRIDGGYRCYGGSETHLITDKILVRGDSTYYSRADSVAGNYHPPDTEIIEADGWWWVGPFTASPGSRERTMQENILGDGKAAKPEYGPQGPKPKLYDLKSYYFFVKESGLGGHEKWKS
jgi:hypothetical protein